MAHWTTESSEAFIRRVTFDFWTQIQKRLELLPLTQFELAKLFEVSESAVSQTLNNSKNPTLKTLFNYSRAAKLKFAIVPYEDTDPDRGPVNSEIFTICWEKAGRPRTFGQASALPSVKVASTGESLIVPARKGYYTVSMRQAATYLGDVEQATYLFRGAGFKAEAMVMETAITEAQAREAA